MLDEKCMPTPISKMLVIPITEDNSPISNQLTTDKRRFARRWSLWYPLLL